MGRIRNRRRSEDSKRSRAGRAPTRTALFAAGLVVGCAVGAFASDAWTRGSAALDPHTDSSRPPAAAASSDRDVPNARALARDPSPAPSRLFGEWLASQDAPGDSSWWERTAEAGIDLVAESVIDQLEEDSLRSLIASTTDFSSEELAEIEDVPGFALGLAKIAMAGTVREAEAPTDAVRPIDFAEDITWDHRAALAQSQFPVDAERIYAVFESDELGLSQTLAKWTRVDDGEILLFKRHRIRRAAASSYVYLDAPPAGFRPGEYRVDFYSADRELRWLASGEHRITL